MKLGMPHAFFDAGSKFGLGAFLRIFQTTDDVSVNQTEIKGIMKRGSVTLLVAALFAGVACTVQAASSLVIVGADTGLDLLAAKFAGSFSTVGTFDAMSATPTLSDLSGYDSVLAFTNQTPSDGTVLGNVLADYVDAGGHLVLCTYAFYTGPCEINGRIMTHGYSPLVNLGTNGVVSGTINALVPGDPIFSGVDLGAVTFFHNGNFGHLGLDSGATLLADDGAGVDMIARNTAGDIYALNLWPGVGGFGDDSDEFFKLLNNATTAEGRGSVPDSGLTLVLLGMGLLGLGAIRRKLR